MKRFTLALAILTFIAATLPAQLLHDPYDPIYKDFDVWATKEYLQVLPPVRPYPIQLAQDLLRTVVQKGDSESSKQAARYLAALERGSVHGSVQAGLVGENDDITPQSAFSGYAWFSPESWLSGSLSFDAWAVKRSVGTEIRVPGIYSPYPDMINDTSNIGSFQILQNWNSIVSLGSRKVYFQAGLNRGSFGPFFENGVVLGPQAGHAGHFSAVYLGQGWKASMVHLALAATNQFGTDRLPDKHLVLHSFDFMVLPDVEIGAFEAVIYGDRLDLLYMAPFNFLFQAQGVTGFYDNSLLGLHGTWKVQPGLKFMGLVYVDDLSFNDLAKLNLDTKYKFAAQAGGVWTPFNGPLSSLAADYTAIMPYMYTHSWTLTKDDFALGVTESKTNYSNYLHMGQPLGTDLLPNSDRLSLRTVWDFLPFTSFRLGAEFLHHGNATANSAAALDGRDDMFENGDYIDDGRDENGNATFQDKTRFLTQDVIETKLRVSPGMEIQFPTIIGALSISTDCVVEYGWNRRMVDQGPVEGNDGLTVSYVLSSSWRY